MSWREKTVIRILLMVGKFMADEAWKRDIESLSNHISCWTPEKKAGE